MSLFMYIVYVDVIVGIPVWVIYKHSVSCGLIDAQTSSTSRKQETKRLYTSSFKQTNRKRKGKKTRALISIKNNINKTFQ